MNVPKEASAHCSKAEEFLSMAALALASGKTNAAASNAVLAGINAKDAICLMSMGERESLMTIEQQSRSFSLRARSERAKHRDSNVFSLLKMMRSTIRVTFPMLERQRALSGLRISSVRRTSRFTPLNLLFTRCKPDH